MFQGVGDPLFLLYIGTFALAGLVCLLSLRGLTRIEDTDTRHGLGALLVLSGGWAFAHVAYLLAPEPQLQYLAFVVGIVLGIAAVGPWLYFCSAYTGRSLHRNRQVQQATVGTFLGIIAIKATNPIHEQYFTAEVASTPFPHLAIHHEPLHWLVMGLAYALAIVGFFMLFEFFLEVSYDTRPLAFVVGLTGLPVIFDFLGAVTPYLLDVTHSPLGVAAFAVGILYVYTERFQTIQLTGESDNPVILLDQDGHLRDWNRSAESLFPGITNAIDQPLAGVTPGLADALNGTTQVISVERDGTTRYYQVSTNPFSTANARLGTMVTLTDITDREQYRQQLEHQKERLEEFASIVSHDLRNPLNVAELRLEQAIATDDFTQLEHVAAAHQRMKELIDDLLLLARSGVDVDAMEQVTLAELARECWNMIEGGEARLVVELDDSMVVQADRSRLRQLLENLYRNAIEHGGAEVTITVGPLEEGSGFFVEDNGAGISEEHRDDVLQPGFTTQDDGTGFGLSIVAEIARGHGWAVAVRESSTGGARFEVSGIESKSEKLPSPER